MPKKNSKSSKLVNVDRKYDLFNQLLVVVIIATLTSFPFIFDSFTVSKILVLAIGLTYVSFRLFFARHASVNTNLPKSYVLLPSLFVLSITLSWFESDVPLIRGLFGQFGRGNGLIYYAFAITIFVFTIKTFKPQSSTKMHELITLLSWILCVYAALQQIDVDISKLDTRGISPVVLTFGNSNFAGGMLSVLFAYHFTYFVVSKSYGPKHSSLLVALILCSTFPGAVQGYLIILFAIGVGASIWLVREYPSALVSRLVLAGWLFSLASVILGMSGKFIFASVFSRSSFQARIEYWKISIEIIKDYPIFGIGPDKLYDVTSYYMPPGSLKVITATRMDNAHNWFLNLGANYGLISFFFLVLIMLLSLFACASILKGLTQTNFVSTASAVAFMAIFIDALVSLEQPGIGIWLYLFAGVVIASNMQLLKSKNHGNSDTKTYGIEERKLRNPSILFLSISLLFSCVVISQRIYFDATLRSNVQSVLLNKGNLDTLATIESAALKLRSEPEYSVQALSVLAKLGDVSKIDTISRSVYEYDRRSIQANLIRADVLGAMNREKEACYIRSSLIVNSPWDFNELNKYVACLLVDRTGPDSVHNLKSASRFFPEPPVDLNIEKIENFQDIASSLSRSAVYARSYFIVGDIELARKWQSYSNVLITQLSGYLNSNPQVTPDVNLDYCQDLINF